MHISIELTDDQSRRLRDMADFLRVAPDQLGHAAVVDLLAQPQPDFQRAAEYVLHKSQELYERLR